MSSVSILHREMYSEADAARLLRVPQQTLHYWLEGEKWRGNKYLPVIRPEPTGQKVVTWAEFVEAALLSQYRRADTAPLGGVRRFIAILREKTGEPYPLAREQPWSVSQRLVILQAQAEAGLDAEYLLYAPVHNQLLLLPPAKQFLDRVDFKDDVAVLWRPAGRESPVVIDPEVRSGKPAVDGISTTVLKEYSDEGYSYEEIARDFSLPVRRVELAVAYELNTKSAA
jgi:uncharacterized protein (DUF433 family)